MEETYETIADTAHEAGRDPDEITVSPYVPCTVSDDPDEASAVIRNHLAYYLGSSDGYKNAAALSFSEQAEKIAQAWREGDRDTARKAVTGEMIDSLAIIGTSATARKQLETLAARDIVDDVIASIPIGASDSLRKKTVAELSPSQ